MSPAEDPTRARLIEAAGEVFADHGFQAATVREICSRAAANVAAVNYHFRDKMGLYLAVIEHSIAVASPGAVGSIVESKPPEEALGLIVHHILHLMYGRGERRAWHVRIMAHELAQPTAALDCVIERVIGPNYAAVRRVLARMLGTPSDHDTTRLCAHSVIAQVVHYAHARPVIARLWPALKLDRARLDQIAAHITAFSLHAVRGLAKRNAKKRKGATR
jgi:AcrR family transcriptional regulator